MEANNLKKKDVCLDVSTPEKHKEVIKLLQKYKEEIYGGSVIFNEFYQYARFGSGKRWGRSMKKIGYEITLSQLEEILKKEHQTEMPESIETLTETFKNKAKELGFKVDIVFEKVDPRIGMFGRFWDNGNYITYGLLSSISDKEEYPFYSTNNCTYKNFYPLKQSEIAELIKNNPK